MTIKWRRDEFSGYVSEAGRVWKDGSEWAWAPAHRPNYLTRSYLMGAAKRACEKAHSDHLRRTTVPPVREILDLQIEASERAAGSVGDAIRGGESALLAAALRQCRSCMALDGPLVEALIARWKAAQR